MPGVGETTYYYDFENRLTTINLPTSQLINFTYDGDKRRTSKTVDFTSQTTTTKFFYDGINILKDLDGNGAVKASYVQGIGIDKLISVSYTSSSEPSYYHSDALGSVRFLTDDSGTVQAAYSYDAWGNINEQTGTSDNEYKFTSRRWEEEIGLQYNRARFYDPEIGRFTTPDPLTGGPDDPTICYTNDLYSMFHRFIKEHTDSLQPHKLNRYVYCYNNPVNLIDPLGLVTGVEEGITVGTLVVLFIGYQVAEAVGWDTVAAVLRDLHCEIASGARKVTDELIKAFTEEVDPKQSDWNKHAEGDAGEITSSAKGAEEVGEWTEVESEGAEVAEEGANDSKAEVEEGKAEHRSKIDRNLARKERKNYWKREARENSQRYNPKDLERMKQGKAPIGKDGKPVELHHKDGTHKGGVEPKTRTDHRLGDNYRKSHPWLFEN